MQMADPSSGKEQEFNPFLYNTIDGSGVPIDYGESNASNKPEMRKRAHDDMILGYESIAKKDDDIIEDVKDISENQAKPEKKDMSLEEFLEKKKLTQYKSLKNFVEEEAPAAEGVSDKPHIKEDSRKNMNDNNKTELSKEDIAKKLKMLEGNSDGMSFDTFQSSGNSYGNNAPSNSYTSGYNPPGNGGYQEPAGGYGNQTAGGYGNQSSGGYGGQAGGYGNQAAGGSYNMNNGGNDFMNLFGEEDDSAGLAALKAKVNTPPKEEENFELIPEDFDDSYQEEGASMMLGGGADDDIYMSGMNDDEGVLMGDDDIGGSLLSSAGSDDLLSFDDEDEKKKKDEKPKKEKKSKPKESDDDIDDNALFNDNELDFEEIEENSDEDDEEEDDEDADDFSFAEKIVAEDEDDDELPEPEDFIIDENEEIDLGIEEEPEELNFIEEYCREKGYNFANNETDLIEFIEKAKTGTSVKLKTILGEQEVFYINSTIAKILYSDAIDLLDEDNMEEAIVLLKEICLSSVDPKITNKALSKLKQAQYDTDNNPEEFREVLKKTISKEQFLLKAIYSY